MKLMILDGNSIMNRAYYGVKLLSTRDGLYTNAVFGFLNIMEKMRQQEQPDALCAAFDLRAPTFRHQRYEGYKATRHPMPEELAMQMPLIKQVLQAMRIPIFTCEGWEADDILGTVGKQCCQKGWQCVIVTGDRDSLQLIDDCVQVKLMLSKSGDILYDEAVFEAEYGFKPPQMVDLKALMGDSSDNIPGVAGIGPKTATNLLLQFGSLENIYQNLDAVKESVRKKLELGKESAFLSYELATIRCDAPIEFTPEDCLLQAPDRPALLALFERLQFFKLIDRYHLRQAEEAEAAEAVTASMLQTLPEANGTLAISLQDDEIWVANAEGVMQTKLDLAYLTQVFAGAQVLCVDLKHLLRTLWKRAPGLQPAQVFDVSLAGYVLDPTMSEYDVEHLSARYLSRSAGAGQVEQTAAMLALAPVLKQELREKNLERVYYEIDLPLCFVLARMEQDGVQVDQAQLRAFQSMLEQRIEALQAEIFSLAGEPFNIQSTKKLAEVLFEKLDLPPVKKTKTGYSTNAEVLEKLRGRHPIIEKILDYRQLTKLKSTYADGLLKVVEEDGRIRTTFQNMVTATGRLSSTDPNLQNIPVRTQLGSEIRKMFVPRPGCVFIDADYSQIELRVLAHIADDRAMQAAFLSGEDFHTVTASQVFDVPVEDVTPLQRRSAKAVNFGIVYGISKWSLSEDIGVSVWEAERYIQNYLSRFSGVRAYMQDIVAFAKEHGYVETLFGRRRPIPELKSSNFNVRSMGERIALNTPVQGTAADIMKLAMIQVEAQLQAQYPEAKLVLQVHDELIVECPSAQAEPVRQLVQQQMQQAVSLSVPLLADAKCGESWYAAK